MRTGITAHLVRFVVMFAWTSAASIAHAETRPDGNEKPVDLRPILKPIREQSGAPALAAAVYRDGKLVALGVCGMRSVESKSPVAESDRFPILSCSKPFARLVLARLAERDAIDLNAPLSKILEQALRLCFQERREAADRQ